MTVLILFFLAIVIGTAVGNFLWEWLPGHPSFENEESLSEIETSVKRPTRLGCALLFLALLCHGAAHAACGPKSLTRADAWLTRSIAAVRVEDAASTAYIFSRGQHEEILPQAMAKSTPAMLGLAAAATMGQCVATGLLNRAHRHRAALAIEAGHLASVGFFANRNWFAASRTGGAQ